MECTGRADNQVKVRNFRAIPPSIRTQNTDYQKLRGFRIELAEVDTHISQHPLVASNVSLVRRDKDEVGYYFERADRVIELKFCGRNPRSYHMSCQT